MSEHHGVPQRPPAYAYLLIDSKDRYDTIQDQVFGTRPANDFTVQRGNALLYGYFTRLAITQVAFDWKLPTIIAGYNDTILLLNTTTQTLSQVVLRQGFYTPAQLAAELQAQIRAEAGFGTFEVTYDQAQNSFLFDTNGGNDFLFVNPYDTYFVPNPNTEEVKLTITKCYNTIGLTGSIPYLSGWQPPQVPPTPLGDETLVGAVPNMIYTRYVDIVSKELTKYQNVKDNDTSPQNQLSQVIARVYTTPPNSYIPTGVVPGAGATTDPTVALGDRPFTLCVDYNTPKHIKWNPNEAVYNVDLAVYDEFGDLLPWEAVAYPWEFALTIVASET